MSSPNRSQFMVGIDLGTTHTVVAYCHYEADQNAIKLFKIDQLTAPGEVASLPLLPSVRYHPADGELAEADVSFSATGDKAIIGQMARMLGAKTKGRTIHSAKSWLSHTAADPTADILPWGADQATRKISPLEASASYLSHVKTQWTHKFPEAPLEKQNIVITVPASFDEIARSLTLKAAGMAGLKNVRLLEEPQAVFYDWLRRHQDQLKQALHGIRLLLICDIGGGTTDLTLVKIEHTDTEPKLTRIGVGEHLMLGGDNVDLAVAHLAEKRLANQRKLSAADLSQLVEQCRIAKEKLLKEDSSATISVTILGGGSKLIGGSRTVQLSKKEVCEIALDGFFPLSSLSDLPNKKRSGVVEFGLPYATEPAISKHIAAFLTLHQQASKQALGNESFIPDAILLNGGLFKSHPITQRVIELLNHWRPNKDAVVQLDNIHPELAVAYGAVSSALAQKNKKLKIGGGSARSYFLLIDQDDTAQQHGICLLPRGSEEGIEIALQERQFLLRLGQPVRFHLAASRGDKTYRPGEIIVLDEESFHFLPPLAVVLTQQQSQPETPVQLVIAYTDIGTLNIQCVATSSEQQRWHVEFPIRKKKPSDHIHSKETLPSGFDEAAFAIQQVFGKSSKHVSPKAIKTLRAQLEKHLGSREQWNTMLLRALFDLLQENVKFRRKTAVHERTWFSLSGYCLRPGFGFPLDDWRVNQLWKLYPQGVQYVHETQNWTEWWTLWRRVAGGLEESTQSQLFDDISRFLNPAKARQGNIASQAKKQGYDDMVRLGAVLERLPTIDKQVMGEWLLMRLKKASEPKQTWWAIARIGARVPFHGSTHLVVNPKTITPWLQQSLVVDWRKVPQAGFAATMIGRMSGDRTLDIDPEIRTQIVNKLQSSKSPATWITLVETVKTLDTTEEKQIFGEALPPGLKLL
ncbi:MAG: Hsp70 family protein [Methylococcaceae bacterium]